MDFIDKMFGFQKRITANADDKEPKLTEVMKSSEIYMRMLYIRILLVDLSLSYRYH